MLGLRLVLWVGLGLGLDLRLVLWLGLELGLGLQRARSYIGAVARVRARVRAIES